MKKLLIGTTNHGKKAEYTHLFSKFKTYEIVFPDTLGIRQKPDESGTTFAENSLIKARFYFKESNLPTIADDGGLSIDVLHGEPGVLSRRWPGHEATDEELIQLTLQKLFQYPDIQNRTAELDVVLTYVDSEYVLKSEASIKGHIAHTPLSSRTKGYPFRDLFVVSEIGKYYSQLSDEEHERVNHRKRALGELLRMITLNS